MLPPTLLGLLEARPRHGYDLTREYDARFGEQRPVKRAQVYATLGRLLRDGSVEVVGVEAGDGPDRTTYALTGEGVAQLERWLAQPLDPSALLQSEVYVKVVLALRSGRPAAQVLDAQRAAHLALMRRLTEDKRGAPLSRTIAHDFALFHLEADVRWIEHTADRLDRLAEELG